MLQAAVFILSFSALTFEVLLARIFSISQWNHLSFMVISIALFGFAVSGTLLSVLGSRRSSWAGRLSSENAIVPLLVLYSISAVSAFLILNRMPLDYMRLPLEPVQLLYLLGAYLLLAIPFFFTGLMISIAYAFFPEKTASIYLSTMAGSGFGAALPLFLLPLLGEEKLMLLSSAFPILLVFFGLTRGANRKGAILILLGILSAAALLSIQPLPTFMQVKPSPYKSLSHTLRFPDTTVVHSAAGLRGRMDSVRSPYIRFAPGLSLQFTRQLPRQWAVFHDGDSPLILYDLTEPEHASFSRYTLSYAGYLLTRPEHVLTVLYGGGSAVACSVASGARDKVIVQQDPYLAKILKNHYGISVVNQAPRAYLAQTSQRFSIIHIENWGPSLPGTAALNQETLFTVNAFRSALARLTDTGVMIVSRKLMLPPGDSLRLWAAAYEGLRASGYAMPERHIAMLRNWDTFTLLVTKTPLDRTATLRSFARQMNFDLVYLPDISLHETNQFNLFDEPFHFQEIDRMRAAYRAGTEREYFRSYALDVSPQRDNRPFPSRFLKWSKLKDQYRSTGSRFYSLFLSGEIIVAVVFAQALVISLLLLGIPKWGVAENRSKIPRWPMIYFLAVGAGFMFVELYFIKAYTSLLGDPIISFTVVLSGILISSGAGGFWSGRMGRQGLQKGLFITVAVLGMSVFGLDPLLRRMLGMPDALRLISAFGLLFPFGWLMGLPFPLGMRYLLTAPNTRAYGWALNGCASILTSILSAQIALSFGIVQILACGAAAYFLAFLCVTIKKGDAI